MRPGFVSVRNNWRPMFGALGRQLNQNEGYMEKRARIISFKSEEGWCRRGESGGSAAPRLRLEAGEPRECKSLVPLANDLAGSCPGE